jgi:glycosyltransferase involved in cell wall biosynthesis
MAGVPVTVAISEHNPISNAVSNPGRLKLFLPFLVRRFYPRADAIVAVSATVAADLADFGRIPREKVTAIPNPVLTPALLARMSQAPEHPEWLNAGAPLIVSAARLAPQKDLKTLLRAFSLLRARRDVRLLILGEGRSRASLEALSEELELGHDFRMPGRVLNPLPYMRGADIFALSSIYEGFGNVLVEALAAGCKVVSTDCPGGPREILDGGRYGALVPVGDAPALARALEAALDTPQDAAKLQARARDFNAESIADVYLERILP